MGRYKKLTILAGPLFNETFTDHCVCEGHVAGKLKCSSKFCELGVPVPVGFWKVIIDDESDTTDTWTWIYDEAQYDCLKNFDKAACRSGPTVQTIEDAFSPNGLRNFNFSQKKFHSTRTMIIRRSTLSSRPKNFLRLITP